MSDTVFSNMEKVYLKNDEKDMEISYFLPEYCPSAQRIVRINAFPCITQKDITDTKLFIQGHVSVHVLYATDNQNTLKSINFGEDFSSSFDIPENILNNSDLMVDAKVGVMSCVPKIVSGRELNVKIRLGVNSDVYASLEFEKFECENENIYTLEQDYTVCSRRMISHDFQKLEFELSLDSGMPQVSEILYADAFFVLEKCNAIQNTVNTSGYIDFHCMYMPVESGQDTVSVPINITKKFPFELECNDECIESKSIVLPKFNITGVETQTSYDSYGESRIISICCNYDLCYNVFNNSTVSVCADAYSSEYVSNPIIKQNIYDTIYDTVQHSTSIREKIHIDMRNFVEVCDCFAKFDTCSMENIEGKNFAAIRGNICVIGKGQSGEYNSATIPVSSKIPVMNTANISAKDARLDACVFCENVGVIVKEGESVCEMNVTIDAVALQKIKIDSVSEIVEDTHRTPEKNSDEMVICYPMENQSLWQIAKHYSVSPELIKKVNTLDSDNISNSKILIIP